tara:strand:+ start:513 stop:704 length:192 start_codon:yes stop_codon:yes gene_type:complete
MNVFNVEIDPSVLLDDNSSVDFDTYKRVLKKIGKIENAYGHTCLSAATAVTQVALGGSLVRFI